MESAFHPAFGAHVNYTFEPMASDPDSQVRQTVDKVRDYLYVDRNADLMRELHAACLEEAQGEHPLLGIWSCLKRWMTFRHDADIANDLGTEDPRKGDVVEVLIRPVDQALLIKLRGIGVEDCDGWNMLGACLLTLSNIPCSLATIAADSERPREFSHVYTVAYVDGKRIPLDFSHGPHIGWEAPHSRIKEWQIWPVPVSYVKPLVAVGMLAGVYFGLRYFNRRQTL